MNQISATLVVPGQVVACEGEDAAGFETSRLPLLGGVEDPMHEGLLHQHVQYHPVKKSISIEMIQICLREKVIGYAGTHHAEI